MMHFLEFSFPCQCYCAHFGFQIFSMWFPLVALKESVVGVGELSAVNVIMAVHMTQFMEVGLKAFVASQKLYLVISHFSIVPVYPCSQACNESCSPSQCSVLHTTLLSSIQTSLARTSSLTQRGQQDRLQLPLAPQSARAFVLCAAV